MDHCPIGIARSLLLEEGMVNGELRIANCEWRMVNGESFGTIIVEFREFFYLYDCGMSW